MASVPTNRASTESFKLADANNVASGPFGATHRCTGLCVGDHEARRMAARVAICALCVKAWPTRKGASWGVLRFGVAVRSISRTALSDCIPSAQKRPRNHKTRVPWRYFGWKPDFDRLLPWQTTQESEPPARRKNKHRQPSAAA